MSHDSPDTADRSAVTTLLIGVCVGVTVVAALITHIAVCRRDGRPWLLIAGLLFPPLGFVHGVYAVVRALKEN